MRKLLILFLSLAITVSFAGCIQTAAEPESDAALVSAELKTEGTITPESVQTETPKQETTIVDNKASIPGYDFSYADAADVFANADSYSGKIYASPFQIASDLRKSGDKWVYYAIAYSKNKDKNYYAFLTFKADAPSLEKGEIVYAYGVIKGTTLVEAKNGDQIPFLNLSVNLLETELPDATSADKKAEFSFADAACVGAQDTLNIEVYQLSFSNDGVMLSTKTTDSVVTGTTTYYMDIYAHQNGHFTWYPNCNFWVTGGLIGFDNIPLGALDPSLDLVLEFFPFSEKGKLLYPAIAIPVPLSQQQ